MAMITQETNPELWKKLKAAWERARRPGYVDHAGIQYSVHQLATTGERGFMAMSSESMLSSSSMEGLVK